MQVTLQMFELFELSKRRTMPQPMIVIGFLLLAPAACATKVQHKDHCHQLTIESNENTMDINKKKTVQAKPTTSTAKSSTSKPISDSAGNAKEQKKDELYIVPNQFPLKNEAKKKNDLDDCPVQK